MISLKNEGLIDIDVIKFMGVNVKESDSAIGQFGTGLKYAIAVFLREGIDFHINRDGDIYTFETQTKTIRGQEFDICCMYSPYDSIELGFTTHLGSGWELWQAYREIHSNCLDEGGVISITDKATGQKGCTTFNIDIDIDPGDIFIDKASKKVLFVNDKIEIYEGESDCIFYKGIKAKILKEPSIYTYNIKKNCTLTEDRLLCYDYEVSEFIADTVSSMKDKQIIKSVISAKAGSYENSVRHCSYFRSSPSKEFSETIKETPNANHQFKEYAKYYEPKPVKTKDELRREFIINIKSLCDEYDVDVDESDTSSIVMTLSGGILDS